MTRIYAFREANMQDKTVYNNILLNDVHKTFNYYYFGKKKPHLFSGVFLDMQYVGWIHVNVNIPIRPLYSLNSITRLSFKDWTLVEVSWYKKNSKSPFYHIESQVFIIKRKYFQRKVKKGILKFKTGQNRVNK